MRRNEFGERGRTENQKDAAVEGCSDRTLPRRWLNRGREEKKKEEENITR